MSDEDAFERILRRCTTATLFLTGMPPHHCQLLEILNWSKILPQIALGVISIRFLPTSI